MAKESAAERKALAIAECDKLGITTKGKTVPQLEKAIEQARLGGDPTTPPASEPEVTGNEKKAVVAHVDGANGRIRTYSKEVHGATFIESAKEFASKEQGRSVVVE